MRRLNGWRTRPRIALLAALLGLAIVGTMVMAANDRGAVAQPDFEAEKRSIEQRYEELKRAPRVAKPADPEAARPPASVPEEWPTGIFEESQAPFSSEDVRIVNHWQAKVGDHYVQVYAGSLTQQPQQGVVIVTRTSLRGAPLGAARHRTPQGIGPVRIVAADGLKLTLAAVNGRSLTFDVATAQFGRP